MIRKLRRRHLSMTLVLAIVVPALILAAVLARRPMPRQEIPAELARP
jgi:hypothetical protein